MPHLILLTFLCTMSLLQWQDAVPADTVNEAILIDDFESYPVGSFPFGWKVLSGKELVPLEEKHMNDREKFYIVQDGNKKVLRGYTDGEVVTLSMANEPEGFDWDLETHPNLAWDWRALQLPEGAREDKNRLNDSGLALYVFFAFEGWPFKRPKAIKYAYSTTLPVGSVLDYGKLKVIVASSGEDGIGDWEYIERNVVNDYRRVFGEDPKSNRPISIRLWSDTDNTKSVSEGDFNNIRLLPVD